MLSLLCLWACERSEAPLGPPDPKQILAGLPIEEPIGIALETDRGNVECELDAKATPRGVSLFIGLSTGQARWKNPKTGTVTSEPLYRDLTFHRSIPGVMLQSGCPIGDGTGSPGYRIGVEATAQDSKRLREPGALALARYTPPPYRKDPNPPPAGMVLGSQFFITLSDMSHLSGKVSVLGRCKNLDVVASLARAVRRERKKPRLLRVRVNGGSSD